MHHRLLITLGLLVLCSCSSTDALIKRYKGVSIAFGTSGGFSGATQGYRLETNGTVHHFQGRFEKRREYPPFHVDANDAVDFYKRLDEMKFADLSYNGNGNINYFVELRSDTVQQRIRWSPGDTLAPLPVRRFYDDIMRYMNEHAPKIDSGDAHR